MLERPISLVIPPSKGRIKPQIAHTASGRTPKLAPKRCPPSRRPKPAREPHKWRLAIAPQPRKGTALRSASPLAAAIHQGHDATGLPKPDRRPFDATKGVVTPRPVPPTYGRPFSSLSADAPAAIMATSAQICPTAPSPCARPSPPFIISPLTARPWEVVDMGAILHLTKREPSAPPSQGRLARIAS